MPQAIAETDAAMDAAVAQMGANSKTMQRIVQHGGHISDKDVLALFVDVMRSHALLATALALHRKETALMLSKVLGAK